ncbi:MAG: CHAD domain-containing protein [Eggerthellaceae bacterium]|nr:CHAD domain-containing protein [Eggerthellaceae bacterium]
MRKNLVLVRHGKALPLSDGQQDIDRSLSEAGIRSLKASLPHQLSMLKEGTCSVEVWTSPALRAIQTAELLYWALAKRNVNINGDIQEYESLWTQSESEFLADLRACKADTVFAVGHNPFVEDLAKSLVGAEIPCATGALVCLSLDFPDIAEDQSPATVDNSRLLWFAQGPISQRWKTLVKLEEIIAAAADSVDSKRKAFFDDPDDIETLHKFRVSIRTLRSLIAFVKPWQDAKQNAAIQSDLREIVGYTSKLRELDVFAQQARESTSGSEDLAVFCELEASCERERVISALKSKRLTRKLKRALSLARSLSWKKRFNKRGLSERKIRARFDAMISELEDELSDLKLSEVERTHDVRKRAKRVRYAAENFKDILGDDAPGIAKGMTSHQDNLGAVCDARVNISLINEFLERDIPEHVAWELTLLRAQNETFLYSALRDDAASEQEETLESIPEDETESEQDEAVVDSDPEDDSVSEQEE